MGLEPAGLISADSDDEVGPVPGQRDRAGEIAPDVALDLREHRRGMDRKCVKTCSRSGE